MTEPTTQAERDAFVAARIASVNEDDIVVTEEYVSPEERERRLEDATEYWVVRDSDFALDPVSGEELTQRIGAAFA